MKMEAQIRLINIDSIIPNRFQPRLQFDKEALDELAASIKEHGIIQPLVLRRAGDKFEIIAGERRFKAASLAGLTSVPAIIAELDDNESAEVAIIENTHRRNLSAIEEAKSYKKLLDRNYVTQEQLAKRLGTSQSSVANKIRLLTLAEPVQDAVLHDKISERHARSLLRVNDKGKQVELLQKIITEKWPVRRLDNEIDIIQGVFQKNGDIDIDGLVSNSVDILANSYTPKTDVYNNEVPREKKKDSLFFDNLENESVNMNPSLGFNPFKTPINASDSVERDYELLELDDEEEPDEIETIQEIEEKVYKEPEYQTRQDVIEGIKKIIANAKKNQVALEVEEFDFDPFYQFIVRIPEEKEDK